MTEYRFARPEEDRDILDFINLVFSQLHVPHHFDRLLPKVYAHPGFSRYHAVAVEEGRILATVAVLPLELRMQNAQPLRGGFVGSVSVHERARGEGHMKALMAMQIQQAKDQDYDFLVLGGQRQRYGYWDFEQGASRFHFSLNAANIRHALKDVDASGVSFRKITRQDDPALEDIESLFAAQPLFCTQPRELLPDVLQSWQNSLFVVEEQGAFLGYLTAGGDHIAELALKDESRLPQVMKAWMAGRNGASLMVPVYLPKRARQLKAFAESYSLGDGEMLRILNWPRVLESALNFKRSYQPLAAGRRVVEIEGAGRFALSVQGAQITVTETTDAPCRVLTARSAVEYFFSAYAALAEEEPLLRSWLPLPMDIPPSQGF